MKHSACLLGLIAALLPLGPLAQPATCSPALPVHAPTAQPGDPLRPTQDLGWFVSVRPSSGHAAALAELAARRAQLATGSPARAAFEAQLESLERGAREARQGAEDFARSMGLEPHDSSWLVPGFAVDQLDAPTRAALEARSDVLFVQPIHWQLPQIGTAVDANHHDAVGANALTIGGLSITGHGVEVAVLDSGLDLDMNGLGRPHKAFYVNGDPSDLSGGGIAGSRVLTSVKIPAMFYFGPQVPEDLFGHGTRVAAAVGASKWTTGPNVANSVAYSAGLHNYKISDDGFPGAPASTLVMQTALETAVSHPEIRVANLSYDGDPHEYYHLNVAIDNAVNAGLFVGLSAGNQGSNLSFAHGAFNGVAVGNSYKLSAFPYPTSAVGPLDPSGTTPRRYPDLLATGELVTSAKLDDENSYQISTGTSIAAGFVSGAAALLFQSDPSLTPVAAKALLLQHTWDNAGGDPNAGGLGYLRIKEAVEAALAGEVRTGELATDGSSKLLVQLTAGTPVRYTFAWNRVLASTIPTASGMAGGFDFDMQVFDPTGALVASSATDYDVVEQVRFTPAVSGTYTIMLREPAPLEGVSELHPFAIAGPGLGLCSTGVGLVQITPAELPAALPGTAASTVELVGCGFDTLTDVRVGGASVPFAVSSPNALQLQLTGTPAFGATPLELVYPGGTTTASIDITGVPPTLIGPGVSPVIGASTLTFASKPGDVHFILASLVQAPSVLPGLFALDIGANFGQLSIAHTGVIPSGSTYDTWDYYPLGLSGLVFYAQSVVVDPMSSVLPLEVSNVHSTLIGL